jgi:G3E family GTPase
VGLWSQAGATCSLEPGGQWWAATPKEEWPEDAEDLSQIEADSQGEYGDRRQELVFIGIEMDEAALRKGLDDCLLTDEEFALGPAGWSRFPDPLVAWDTPACAVA